MTNEPLELPENVENNKYYVFGKKLGNAMNNVSIGFQYESQIMGFLLLILSMLFYAVYTIFFTTGSWFWRGYTLFNIFCGLLILSSSLITTLQQLIQYNSIQQVQTLLTQAVSDVNLDLQDEAMKGGNNNGKKRI